MEAASVPAAETADAPEAGEPQAAPEAPDFSPVLDRMNEVSAQFGQVAPLLQQLAAQQEEGDPEDPAPDLEALLAEYGEPGDAGLDPQAVQQYVDAAIKQGVEQGVAELREQVTTVQRHLQDLDVDALVEQYPQLAEKETQAAVAQEVADFTNRHGIKADADIIETFYLAKQARDRALGESPTGTGAEVQLEGGSGGAPGAPSEDDPAQVAQRILMAGGNSDPFGR